MNIICINMFAKPIVSLAPGKFEWNFTKAIFKLILVIDVWDISFEIVLWECHLSLPMWNQYWWR